MYKYGFSLPSLAEIILYQFSIKGFDEYLKKTAVKLRFRNTCSGITVKDKSL